MVREERAGTVGLKARDSQREEDPERQRRVKDSSDIHLVLQYLSLTWTDSVSAERSELDHSLYTRTHTHTHIGGVWNRGWEEKDQRSEQMPLIFYQQIITALCGLISIHLLTGLEYVTAYLWFPALCGTRWASLGPKPRCGDRHHCEW